jgi:hypothetical protein
MHNVDLSALFHALAILLDEGEETIAATGAAALRRHASAKVPAEQVKLSTNKEIAELLNTQGALPCAQLVSPVLDDLSWHYSGYDDGRISPDVALRMQTVEMIGADGMIYHDTCRVGLFAQTADTDYIIRTHAAEELFVQIAGEAEWCKGEKPYTLRRPGDRMHHASYEPHASRTTNSALIAVWVWAGDLGYDKYAYKG